MNAWSYHEFTLRTSQLRHTLFITVISNYCRSIKHGAWCYLWIGVGKKIDFKIRILPFKKRAYFETTFSKVDPVMAWPCWTALEGPSSLSRCRETTPRSSRSRMEHGGTARRRRTLGPKSQTFFAITNSPLHTIMVRSSHRSKSNVTRSILLPPCSTHGMRGGRKISGDGRANKKTFTTVITFLCRIWSSSWALHIWSIQLNRFFLKLIYGTSSLGNKVWLNWSLICPAGPKMFNKH